MHEDRFQGPNGLEIFTRTWVPDRKARAIVVIVHGFNSHGGQYGWVASELTASGYVVHALDLPGRGRSAGERYYIDDVAKYVESVAILVRRARNLDPSLPVFLFGHSAGGVIACSYALDHQGELAGLVCESFAFRVPAPELVLRIVAAVSRIAPRLGVLRLKNRDFSRDPAAVAALEGDPLIHGEVQPARTVAAMLRANDRLEREFSRLTLPVLILHGTADRATKPQGSRFFFEHTSSKDRTLELLDGYAHDLLNDTGREHAMGIVLGWLDARAPGDARPVRKQELAAPGANGRG